MTTTQVGTGNAGNNPNGLNTPPLPVQLGPGQMLVISLGVRRPTAPGTYTFAFGLNYDSVTSAPISTMQPTIFDSAGVKWSGGNCNKSGPTEPDSHQHPTAGMSARHSSV